MAKDINKIFKIILIVCIVVLIVAISSSTIYYYAIFRPRNEQAKWETQLEWEKEKQRKEEARELKEKQKEDLDKIEREIQLHECLDEAYENYIDAWNEQVERLDSKDGFLPGVTADNLDERYEKDKEECFKLYGSD